MLSSRLENRMKSIFYFLSLVLMAPLSLAQTPSFQQVFVQEDRPQPKIASDGEHLLILHQTKKKGFVETLDPNEESLSRVREFPKGLIVSVDVKDNQLAACIATGEALLSGPLDDLKLKSFSEESFNCGGAAVGDEGQVYSGSLADRSIRVWDDLVQIQKYAEQSGAIVMRNIGKHIFRIVGSTFTQRRSIHIFSTDDGEDVIGHPFGVGSGNTFNGFANEILDDSRHSGSVVFVRTFAKQIHFFDANNPSLETQKVAGVKIQRPTRITRVANCLALLGTTEDLERARLSFLSRQSDGHWKEFFISEPIPQKYVQVGTDLEAIGRDLYVASRQGVTRISGLTPSACE